MTNTEGKASQNNEVRQLMDGKWAIMSRANSSINYYAKDEADAHQTLREWDAAPELLETLMKIKASNHFDEFSLMLQKIVNESIKKATN
jgi:hypothetical protein